MIKKGKYYLESMFELETKMGPTIAWFNFDVDDYRTMRNVWNNISILVADHIELHQVAFVNAEEMYRALRSYISIFKKNPIAPYVVFRQIEKCKKKLKRGFHRFGMPTPPQPKFKAKPLAERKLDRIVQITEELMGLT